MKKDEIVEKADDVFGDDLMISTEEVVDVVFTCTAEVEKPRIMDELEKYDGSRYQLFGKLDLLEEMEEESA